MANLTLAPTDTVKEHKKIDEHHQIYHPVKANKKIIATDLKKSIRLIFDGEKNFIRGYN